VIKLDRSLVQAIDGDPSAQALASGIVGFANRSGASVVAEGVERRAQLRTLAELGVEHGQGYCFARAGPLPLRPPKTRRAARTPS
jgi:EAL domain-containing protein (putative c-di-GMP-specific phosphodiesterase class I)